MYFVLVRSTPKTEVTRSKYVYTESSAFYLFRYVTNLLLLAYWVSLLAL